MCTLNATPERATSHRVRTHQRLLPDPSLVKERCCKISWATFCYHFVASHQCYYSRCATSRAWMLLSVPDSAEPCGGLRNDPRATGTANLGATVARRKALHGTCLRVGSLRRAAASTRLNSAAVGTVPGPALRFARSAARVEFETRNHRVKTSTIGPLEMGRRDPNTDLGVEAGRPPGHSLPSVVARTEARS